MIIGPRSILNVAGMVLGLGYVQYIWLQVQQRESDIDRPLLEMPDQEISY